MSRTTTLKTIVLVTAWLSLPAAGAQELPPADVQSGTLLLKMQAGLKTATRTNTDVAMTVSGLVARVSVRQEFRNDGDEWTEGVYVFPLPDEAAVDRMRLHIGERYIEGEIREKEQARKDYERARNEGRKASLVEQERPNLFTTSVANIAPGERVVVEIEYLEDLHYDNGTFSIRFPMTLTPRYIPGLAGSGPTGQRLVRGHDARQRCVAHYATACDGIQGPQDFAAGDYRCRHAAGDRGEPLSSRRGLGGPRPLHGIAGRQ